MIAVKTTNKDAVVEAHRTYRLHPPYRVEDKIHKHGIISKRLIAQPQIVRIVRMVNAIAAFSQGPVHFGHVLGIARQRDGQYPGARLQVPNGKRVMEIPHLDDRSGSDLTTGFCKAPLFWCRDSRTAEGSRMQMQ